VRIDLNDSGPLYRQIAARIAYCIATGRLPAGSRLPSLRKAQHAWGVHLHTVRRAYRELQSRGLVHIQVRGETVVLSGSTRPPATLRELVAAVLHEAEGAFGATAGTVTEEIRAIVQDHPQICVVECSRTLSSGLADQIARAWHVRAAPRLLEEEWPRGQAVISTYFHVRELRARLGERSSRITYLHTTLSGSCAPGLGPASESARTRPATYRGFWIALTAMR
jgi:DNA-binding transcriptional regulator YhcF (GntR family)